MHTNTHVDIHKHQKVQTHTHTHAHTWPQPPLAYLGHSDIRLTRTVTGMPFDLGFALKPSRTVTLQRQVCVVKTSSVWWIWALCAHFAAKGNVFTCPQSSPGQGQHLEGYSDDFMSTVPLKQLADGSWDSEWWHQTVLLLWDIWKCPSFLCQNQRRGRVTNQYKHLA